MSSLNTLTGRTGKFFVGGSTVARTTKWDVNPTLAGKAEWGDSDSNGYTNRAPGRKDATFNAEGKYDETAEAFDIFMPEDIVESKLYLKSGGPFWDFPRALCDDFSMDVDIDTEEVLGWSASFGADGTFTKP